MTHIYNPRGLCMSHALPDFEALYQRCVARVDVNELVVLLDMVGWDDLGGRVWERAIVVASAQLRGCGVLTSGKNDSKQLLLPEDGAATKENLLSSKALHPTPWINSWAKHWYLWKPHAEPRWAVFGAAGDGAGGGG